MSVTKGGQDRFHFMDGLRGIAITMAVVHHAFTANIVTLLEKAGLPRVGYFFSQMTGSCVNLFFVLSGILLLRPYLRSQRKMKVWDYFKRRIYRIYPPYFVALIFGALIAWFNTEYPTWYNTLGMRVQFSWPETFRHLFVISFTEIYYNLAWWSLGIEMVFYVLLPLIVFAFPKPDRLNNSRIVTSIVVATIVTTLLQQLFTLYYPHLYTTANIILPDGRSVPFARQTLWRFIDYPTCFLIGVLLAAKDFTRRQGWIFIFFGAILIAASLYYWFIIHTGFALLYAGIIILAQNSWKMRKATSQPIMIWLGERSYSIFLTHLSVFYLVNNLVSRIVPERNLVYALLTRGIGIPVGIYAAMLLFHYVERKQAKGLITANYFWPWQANRLKQDLPAEEEVPPQTTLKNI